MTILHPEGSPGTASEAPHASEAPAMATRPLIQAFFTPGIRIAMNIAYRATPMPRAMTAGIREEKPAPIRVPLSHARYAVRASPMKNGGVRDSFSDATTKVSSVMPNPSPMGAAHAARPGRRARGILRERATLMRK